MSCHGPDLSAAQAAEKKAQDLCRRFFRENAGDLIYIAHWGDGECGFIKQMACEELGISNSPLRIYKKKAKISRALAKSVFERDAYRCVVCQSFLDLTCDHIVPESKGGPTSLENLQTMCRVCNCKKGDRNG